VRHNVKLESWALAHTVSLEAQCTEATAIQLSPEHASAEVRYDVEAAVRVIPQLLPFTDVELARLRTASQEAPEVIVERESRLFNGWHSWLWGGDCNSRELAVKSAAPDFGGSSVLAVASSRLATGLEVMLDLK
jgi:hypothetical protein